MPRGAGTHSQEELAPAASPALLGIWDLPKSPSQGHAPGSPCLHQPPAARGRLDFGMEQEDVPGRKAWNSFLDGA